MTVSLENFISKLQDGEILTKIIICAALIIFGIGIHYFTKVWIKRLLNTHAKKIVKNSKKLSTLTTFLFSAIKYFLYFLIFYIICNILGVPIDSFFIAIAGAVSVAFGLGAQTLIKNVINGFFILIEDQYSVGDIINIGDYTGTVEEIGMRTTKIRSIDGNLHIIPNGEVSITTNMTKKLAISSVEINLSYEASAERVIDALKDEMSKASGKIDGLINPPNVLGITALGQYCYTIKILADSEYSKYLSVEREIRLYAKNRLDAENIPMPNVPVDFGKQVG